MIEGGQRIVSAGRAFYSVTECHHDVSGMAHVTNTEMASDSGTALNTTRDDTPGDRAASRGQGTVGNGLETVSKPAEVMMRLQAFASGLASSRGPSNHEGQPSCRRNKHRGGHWKARRMRFTRPAARGRRATSWREPRSQMKARLHAAAFARFGQGAKQSRGGAKLQTKLTPGSWHRTARRMKITRPAARGRRATSWRQSLSQICQSISQWGLGMMRLHASAFARFGHQREVRGIQAEMGLLSAGPGATEAFLKEAAPEDRRQTAGNPKRRG